MMNLKMTRVVTVGLTAHHCELVDGGMVGGEIIITMEETDMGTPPPGSLAFVARLTLHLSAMNAGLMMILAVEIAMMTMAVKQLDSTWDVAGAFEVDSGCGAVEAFLHTPQPPGTSIRKHRHSYYIRAARQVMMILILLFFFNYTVTGVRLQ